MKYYEVMYPAYNRHIVEIIVANNEYEAIGFFIERHKPDIGCAEDLHVVNKYDGDYKIEVSCIGLPQYKTLKELHDYKAKDELPAFVCGLLV